MGRLEPGGEDEMSGTVEEEDDADEVDDDDEDEEDDDAAVKLSRMVHDAEE